MHAAHHNWDSFLGHRAAFFNKMQRRALRTELWMLLVFTEAICSTGSGWTTSGPSSPGRSISDTSNQGAMISSSKYCLAIFVAPELGVLSLRGGKAPRLKSPIDERDRIGRRAEHEASMRGKAIMDHWTKKGKAKAGEEITPRIKEGKKRKPWREPLDKGEKVRRGRKGWQDHGRRSWEDEGDEASDSMEGFRSEDGGIGGKLEEWMQEDDGDSEAAKVMMGEMKAHGQSAGIDPQEQEIGAGGEEEEEEEDDEEEEEEEEEETPAAQKKRKIRHEEDPDLELMDDDQEGDEEEEGEVEGGEEEEGNGVWVESLGRSVDKTKMEGNFLEISDEWSEEAAAPNTDARQEKTEEEGPELPAEVEQQDEAESDDETISVVETVLNGVKCSVREETGVIYNGEGFEIGYLDKAKGVISCNGTLHAGSPFLEMQSKKQWFAPPEMVGEGERERGKGEGAQVGFEDDAENPFDAPNAFDASGSPVLVGKIGNEKEEEEEEEEEDEEEEEEDRRPADPIRRRLLELNREKAAKIEAGEGTVLDGGFITFRDEELPSLEAAHVFDPVRQRWKAGGSDEALRVLRTAGVLGAPAGLNGTSTRQADKEEGGEAKGRGESARRGASLERALAKKLRQIEAIEARMAAGGNVTGEQRAKVEAKAEVQAQLALFAPPAPRDKTRNRFAAGNTGNASSASRAGAGAEMAEWRELGLHPLLLLALRNLSFTAPTPIQKAAVQTALGEGADVIGIAETGAGKTLAFALPILHTILSLPPSHPLVTSRSLVGLVVCPTRELALQVHRHVAALCGSGRDRIRTAAIVGGLSDDKQRRVLKMQPQVVVGTPGRLWDLVEGGEAHLVSGLRTVRFIVLDEADRLVSTGHFKEVRNLLQRLPDTQGKSAQQRAKQLRRRGMSDDAVGPGELPVRQGFLFSATYEVRALAAVAMLEGREANGTKQQGGREGGERERVNMVKLAKRLLRMAAKPRVIDVTSQRVVASRVKQVVVKLSPEQRDDFVYFFLRFNPGRTIVFVNHISVVRRLSAILSAVGVEARPLHAAMQQRARLRNIDLFRQSDRVVLVCTDVAARGLDIPTVQHVLHFDVPHNADTYTHRSGRAAHQPGAPKGYSLLLVDPRDETAWGKARAITDSFKGAQRVQVHSSQLKSSAHLIVLGRRLAMLRLKAARQRAGAAWKKKAAADMEIEEDDDSQDSSDDKPRSADELAQASKEMKTLEAEIAEVLPRLRAEEKQLDAVTIDLNATSTNSTAPVPASLCRPKGVIVGGRAQLDWLTRKKAKSAPIPQPTANEHNKIKREGSGQSRRQTASK